MCGYGSVIKLPGQFVQKLNNAIRQINHHPVDSAVSFTNTYPLCSDLSDAKRYPAFEQPVPGRINTSNGMNARAGCINYIVR